MRRNSQQGVALIVTLIIVFVLTVMAVSMMFVAQTETWSSYNYRMMSQAEDGAQAGINAGAGFIVNNYSEPGSTTSSYNYTPHSLWDSFFPVAFAGSTVTDPTSAYTLTTSPVQYNGAAVVLSGDGTTSNYPVASVQSAFNTNGVGNGSVTAGGVTVNYASHATLMSMVSSFVPFGQTNPTTVQTWKFSSQGSISGIKAADVQVTATLEQHIYPTFRYAAFATDTGCSALQFGGGGTTDSYNSTAALSGGVPVISDSAGNVGTNGNLGTNGSVTVINGTLSTPRAGVGSCTSSSVTAWTDSSGSLSCGSGLTNAQCLVSLPQNVPYPMPTIPPAGTTSITSNSSCPSATAMTTAGGTCVVGSKGNAACANNTMCLAPSTAGGTMSLDTLTITGSNDLHLAAGIYNIDSITESGSTSLVLDSTPVILNVTGASGGTVVKLTGGGLVNTAGAYSSTSFQILYAGSGTISLKGGSSAVGLVYAPGASFSFGGNSTWYGAVVGKDMTDMGGTDLHYDRNLQTTAYSVGPWMLDSYSWKKY